MKIIGFHNGEYTEAVVASLEEATFAQFLPFVGEDWAWLPVKLVWFEGVPVAYTGEPPSAEEVARALGQRAE